ncbi:hypothetical protein BD289DRAFT_279053 [Coniella lustricola]|uniref:Secreted protein n=1 Tax=Coniella lustricola TaxID=2025994 RepID=A0A2T3A6A7_9PEZI|nr:hypothetical protein BD289DRAFT_279053 [Coniella lustricola]
MVLNLVCLFFFGGAQTCKTMIQVAAAAALSSAYFVGWCSVGGKHGCEEDRPDQEIRGREKKTKLGNGGLHASFVGGWRDW